MTPTQKPSARALLGSGAGVAGMVLLLLAGCDKPPPQTVQEPRPVRTTIAAARDKGETVLLTGTVQAQDEVPVAFRIGGRMLERPVNVGDRVETGQVLAKLDPQDEVSALRSAQASLAAAQAALTQTRAAYERARILLGQGHIPRSQYDLALKAMETAQS